MTVPTSSVFRAARRLSHWLVPALLLAVWAPAPTVSAQQPPPAAAPEAPRVLAVAEVVPEALKVAARGKALEADLVRIGDFVAQEVELDVLRERRLVLESRLEDLKLSGRTDLDSLGEIRRSGTALSRALKGIGADAASRLAAVEGWKREWQAEDALWRDSLAALPRGSRSRELEAAAADARRHVGEALALLAESEAGLLAFQRRTADVEDGVRTVFLDVEKSVRETKEQMFRRTQPSVFEPEFYVQFGPGLGEGVASRARGFLGAASGPPGGGVYGVLLVQLALMAVLGWAIRSRGAEISERWRFVAQHPVSAAVFGALSLTWALTGPFPVPWRLLAISGLVVSTARLAAALVARPWRARLLYLLAAILLLFKFLVLAGFPEPLLRVYVLVVAAGGGVLCWWRAEENRRAAGLTPYVGGLRLGAVVLAVVFAAEAGGYSGLARHALEASLWTVFFLVFVRMAGLLGSGGIEFLLRHPVAQRSPVVRKEWPLLLRRTGLALDVVLWFLGLAAVLRAWGVYDTLSHAWQGLLSLGITLGQTRITVGIVAAAAIALCAALLVSWVVQRILDERVYPRRGLEFGVRVSVNRLVHYAFVLVGVLLASSLLGFGVDRVTILAGAFGVGIGFGLQTIVNNFVSGLILLFERPIKVGDVVDLNGQWAVVRTIGLRATVVQTYALAEVIVPNSELVSGRVTNLTLEDRVTRVAIPVGVAYGSDVPTVLGILGEVAARSPWVRKDPEPQVLFLAFGASALEFELRAYAELEDTVVLRSELLQEIDRRFRAAGVQVPFPQRDLHLKTVDERARQALASLAAAPPPAGSQG